jgi:uncharacterized protein (TIGR00159 family)
LSFIEIKFLDILDILLVALLLYELYNLLKGTVAINIFFGLVAFYLLWKLVTALDMEMLSEIFGAFISVGFIALIVVFQPEIRKFLLMLGTPGFIKKKRHRLLFWKFEVGGTVQLDIDEIIDACRYMSETKTGALIIISNRSGLEQFVETGERLDARISASLLENIFFKNSPLHDGAVIIRNNKIVAARCILPVSSRSDIPSHFGLRHRSAIGLTEQSDAVAIIVSEETGNISFSAGGDIKEKISSISLKSMILEELS